MPRLLYKKGGMKHEEKDIGIGFSCGHGRGDTGGLQQGNKKAVDSSNAPAQTSTPAIVDATGKVNGLVYKEGLPLSIR